MGATVPYALATLQAPYEERKDSEKKPSSGVLLPPIPIMHKKAHISQGFKQGLRIGCEGSQMTSRPQFPPYGINKLWFLTLQGWYLPLKTCWRWILIPLKCTVPLISAYNFKEVGDLQLQSKVPRFKIHGLGNCCFLTTQKNWQTIIIPYVHWRFIVYKAILIPQTSIGRGGNWGADRLQSDLPKVTRPAGG